MHTHSCASAFNIVPVQESPLCAEDLAIVILLLYMFIAYGVDQTERQYLQAARSTRLLEQPTDTICLPRGWKHLQQR